MFHPFIVALNAISNGILRLIGDPTPTPSSTRRGTPEELKLLIAQSLHGGQLDPGEAGMLVRASSTSTSRRRAR